MMESSNGERFLDKTKSAPARAKAKARALRIQHGGDLRDLRDEEAWRYRVSRSTRNRPLLLDQLQ